MTAAPTIRVGIDAHTLGSHQTGNETYVRSLAEALCEVATPEIELVTYYTRQGARPTWPGRARAIWPHTPVPRLLASFPLSLLRDRIDVAHFQYVMPPLCPCPAVVTVHDVSFAVFAEFFPFVMRHRLMTLVPLALRRAAHVLTISEFSKREILHHFGGDPERITVAPLAASPAFRPIDRDAATATARGLGVSQPFILAVGNLQPRKNLERLLRAYAQLRQRRGTDHQLVLVGQRGFRGRDVASEVRALGLERSVVLTGYVGEAELIALYNAADLFVYPSLYEGFGLPILEAMACGTPVITSNASSMPEVAGTAAVLVEPTDESDIFEAMDRVLADEATLAGMRESGLRRAASFSWHRTAERTLGIYLQCAGERAARNAARVARPFTSRPNP